MQKKFTDILVLGSGIGGLVYAIKCAAQWPHKKITILTKSTNTLESNSAYAQGGIAAVWRAPDDIETHVQDTLKAGDGQCDEAAVRRIIGQAKERIEELVSWGVQFDDNDGEADLIQEGGHSHKRILHHKDTTGREVIRALHAQIKAQDNIELVESAFAVDYAIQDGVCRGAYALVDDEMTLFEARVTLCAMGGAGQLYETTTNPALATGDGMAMALRAEIKLKDMAYVQFHPTAFYETEKEEGANFLISEALRGAGAVLKNHDGDAFMQKYHLDADMAPRDVIARAIDAEMTEAEQPFVFLDATSITENAFDKKFPSINAYCLKKGINPTQDMIPVAPACHYVCGGVPVNGQAETVLRGLLAVGEVASTGLHGANRLASNSLLEGAVGAHEAYLSSKQYVDEELDTFTNDALPRFPQMPVTEAAELRFKIQKIMGQHLGILRSNTGLQRAQSELAQIAWSMRLYLPGPPNQAICEMLNLLAVAETLVADAKGKKYNAGLHFNINLAA